MDETTGPLPDPGSRLPLFPLGSVLFPGMVVPLRVFEERYRAMMGHLLAIPSPTDRLFASVAIREGYEVGDHGQQELYRVGCRLQVSEVSRRSDGSYDIVATCRDRIRLREIDTAGSFPVGVVERIEDEIEASSAEPGSATSAAVIEALSRFAAFREQLREVRGDPLPEALPEDPEYLAWSLGAASPLTLPDRQLLLETTDPIGRLELISRVLREETALMAALPSLPATDLARTSWSPN
mgnify:CR=1 FL=1